VFGQQRFVRADVAIERHWVGGTTARNSQIVLDDCAKSRPPVVCPDVGYRADVYEHFESDGEWGGTDTTRHHH
jgi:hypothetical protein